VQQIRTFRVFVRTPASHSCAQARAIRDFMLNSVRTHRSELASPPSSFVRRRIKYAYFMFLPSPLLLSFVRRRGSYATSVRTHDHALTRRPLFVVRRRSEHAHFVFLGSRGYPWLLQSCPLGPYWGPLGVLTASLDDPSRSSGAFPVPPGALCDHPGCSCRFP